MPEVERTRRTIKRYQTANDTWATDRVVEISERRSVALLDPTRPRGEYKDPENAAPASCYMVHVGSGARTERASSRLREKTFDGGFDVTIDRAERMACRLLLPPHVGEVQDFLVKGGKR